jgi:hypothetical protein
MTLAEKKTEIARFLESLFPGEFIFVCVSSEDGYHVITNACCEGHMIEKMTEVVLSMADNAENGNLPREDLGKMRSH